MKIRPLKSSEMGKAFPFISNAMSGSEQAVKKLEQYLMTNPYHRSEEHFVSFNKDGVWLSHVQIDERFYLRLGGARIRTGLVGYVGTPPEFRNRGLAYRTMLAAQKWAKEKGYKLIILSSAPGTAMRLYSKLGYVRFLDEPHVSIDYNQLNPLLDLKENPFGIKEYSPQFLKEMACLYKETYGRFSGTIERPLKYWKWVMEAKRKMAGSVNGLEPGFSFIAFKDKDAVAYVIGTSGTLHIPEAGTCVIWEAAHREGYFGAYHFLLRKFAESMLKKRLSKLLISAPVTHPIFNLARELGGQAGLDVHRHDLALIPDFLGFLKSLKPALEKRISVSRYRDATGILSVGFGRESFVIFFKNHRCRVLRGKTGNHFQCSKERLVQIFTGYKSPGEVVGLGEAIASNEETLKSAEVLFPDEHSWQSHLDV